MILWTHEHAVTLLPAVVIMIIVAALLQRYLCNKPRHIRVIPMRIVAVLLVLLEIGKQVLSLIRGYDLYHIPLHFCSLFIFMIPVAAFYTGRHREKIMGITGALCYAVVILMLIYPNLIYSDTDIQTYTRNYFAFHTVTFHNLVLFAAILFVALDLHAPSSGERKVLAIYIAIYCIIAAIAAQLLQTNFNNFYSCNVPPLEDVRIAMQGVLGYWPTQIIYVLIVLVLDIAFTQLAYSVYHGLHTLISKRKVA